MSLHERKGIELCFDQMLLSSCHNSFQSCLSFLTLAKKRIKPDEFCSSLGGRPLKMPSIALYAIESRSQFDNGGWNDHRPSKARDFAGRNKKLCTIV